DAAEDTRDRRVSGWRGGECRDDDETHEQVLRHRARTLAEFHWTGDRKHRHWRDQKPGAARGFAGETAPFPRARDMRYGRPMILLNPRNLTRHYPDGRSAEVMRKTVEFFEAKGKTRLKADYHAHVWYAD